jgi:hypothetical protein
MISGMISEKPRGGGTGLRGRNVQAIGVPQAGASGTVII